MGKKLERMIAETYDDPAVAQTVLDHAKELGTVEDIEKGLKVLPHPEDAKRFHETRQAELDRKRGEELRRQQSQADAKTPPPPALEIE